MWCGQYDKGSRRGGYQTVPELRLFGPHHSVSEYALWADESPVPHRPKKAAEDVGSTTQMLKVCYVCDEADEVIPDTCLTAVICAFPAPGVRS